MMSLKRRKKGDKMKNFELMQFIFFHKLSSVEYSLLAET